MTSSMLAGERRWASAKRGGMTILGKVAVPKPINLPGQKLENHGLDPNVEGEMDSDDYVPGRHAEGPFAPKFEEVQFDSLLQTEEERAEYVDRIMVPERVRRMTMMTNQTFHDYSNDILIKSICCQISHLHRWNLLDQDKEKLLFKYNKLKNKVTTLEQEAESETRENRANELEKLRHELQMKVKEKELAEHELMVVKKNLADADQNTTAWKEKFNESETKNKDLILDLAESKEELRLANQRIEALELSAKKAQEEVEKVGRDQDLLLTGLFPKAIDKLHKSYEYAKEMAVVQGHAIAFGGHQELEKVQAHVPTLDISKLEDYNPDAYQQLVEAGTRLEEKVFPFVTRLSSSTHMTAEELLQLEPEPFPQEDAA